MPIIAGRASAAYGAGFGALTTIPYQGPFGAYDALATITVPSGGLASITFAGIPTGYKHLQLRGIGKMTSTGASGDEPWRFTFNGDTGSNYTSHMLYGTGNGGSGNSYSNVNATFTSFYGLPFSGSNTSWGGIVMDILDYGSLVKNKTVRALTGWDNNGNGDVLIGSALWNNSSTAINTVTLTSPAGNLAEYTNIALYGVK
jgi:hypothetical protein